MDVSIRRKEKERYYNYDEERKNFVSKLNINIDITKLQNSNNYLYLEIINIARLPLHCIKNIYISNILGSGDINTVFEICFGKKRDCTKTYALRLELFESEVDVNDWINMTKLQIWLSKYNLSPYIYYSAICYGGFFNKFSLDKKTRKQDPVWIKSPYGIGFTILEKLDVTLFDRYTIDEWKEQYNTEIQKLENIADKMIKLGYIHDDLHLSNIMIRKIGKKEQYIPIDWDESMTLYNYILYHKNNKKFPKTSDKNFFKKFKQFIIRDSTNSSSSNSSTNSTISSNSSDLNNSTKNITKIIKIKKTY